MARLGNPLLHPDIVEANRKARAAASNQRRVVREVQKKCDHRDVFEAPVRRSEWLWSTPAIRVCARCGLEEYDKWGSESGGKWDYPAKGPCDMETAYDKKHVLTTKFVARVSHDEIQRYRNRG